MRKLEQGLVYGPVHSRRFGWDLGVNFHPFDYKLCTFDCVYCQYGFTPPLRNIPHPFPTAFQIILEWSERLDWCSTKGIRISHTTISGNGEPTMHPHFPEVVSQLAHWRDQNAPEIKLALLSNGYRIHDPEIRKALHYLDEPIVKLDAAAPEKLQRINRPLVPFLLDPFIKDLRECGSVVIQTMFVKDWNDSPEDLEHWREALRRIQPREIQIYTIDRDPALQGLNRLSDSDLKKIAEETSRMLHIPVHAFVGYSEEPFH